jgi:hypothetical protein
MNPLVKSVEPRRDHILRLTFDNGDVRLFDVRPYLDKGVFRALQREELFDQAEVVAGSVEWPGEIDLSHDTLFLRSQILAPETA